MSRNRLSSWLLKLRDRLGLRPWRAKAAPTEPLRVPSAAETRRSVARFHSAVERSQLLDFIEERFPGLGRRI